MKSLTLKTLVGIALIAGAASAQAAGSSDYFEQQRMISDGYYPQYNVVPRATKPESAHTAAENAWFVKERIADSNGSRPVPFVAPTAVASQGINAQVAATDTLKSR